MGHGRLQVSHQFPVYRTKQEIANHLRKFDPLINPYVQYVDVPESGGKKVIAIYFDPAEYSDVPYSYDGRPYYKVRWTPLLQS